MSRIALRALPCGASHLAFSRPRRGFVRHSFGYRARLILGEDRPAITAMDQDGWVVRQKHNQREPLELAEAFRALRAQNLHLWRGLSPEGLLRTGVHNERGEESLGLLRTLMAGHDLLHLDQMKRLLMAIV